MAITQQPNDETSSRLTGSPEKEAQGAGGILVIDDDDAIRETLAMILGDEDCEVRTANNWIDALAMLAGWQPELILLDARMPGMDASEFVQRYRAQQAAPAPIVLLTGVNDGAELAAAIGAVGYLAKPFELDDLLTVVSRYAECVDA